MFRMRCCAAADESGYSSDRVREKKTEKEEEMKKRQSDSEIETRMKNEVEIYKTIERKEQPPRRRFTHSRCTLVTGGAICKARSCRRMTHLVRHTDAGVAFRVWVALLKRQAILPLLMIAHCRCCDFAQSRPCFAFEYSTLLWLNVTIRSIARSICSNEVSASRWGHARNEPFVLYLSKQQILLIVTSINCLCF